MSPGYRPRLSAAAQRSIAKALPEPVAFAVIEFINGSLMENPHRVGRPLRGDLTGWHAARRGAFRVIYRIDQAAGIVMVLRIEHRADVYRPR